MVLLNQGKVSSLGRAKLNGISKSGMKLIFVVYYDCHRIVYLQHVLKIAGAQTVAVNVSVRMGHPVTLTVGSVGVPGAGEDSSAVTHAHPPSMGRTVPSSVGARMAAPATTYQESVTAHRAGQDPCK
jgi:hypothetical protein